MRQHIFAFVGGPSPQPGTWNVPCKTDRREFKTSPIGGRLVSLGELRGGSSALNQRQPK